MSFENLIMYGAVIPSFDANSDKNKKNDDKRYDCNTADGWDAIIREARKMK